MDNGRKFRLTINSLARSALCIAVYMLCYDLMQADTVSDVSLTHKPAAVGNALWHATLDLDDELLSTQLRCSYRARNGLHPTPL